MKIKNVLFLIMMILSMARGKAQCQKTNTQFLEVVAGVGVIPTFVKDQLHTDLPPIFAGLDYRINERFSIGSRIGITKVTSASDLLGDGAYEQFRNRFVMAGVRFSVHSRYFEHWDLYGGMNFAYTVSKVEVIKGNVALLKKHLNFRGSIRQIYELCIYWRKIPVKTENCPFRRDRLWHLFAEPGADKENIKTNYWYMEAFLRNSNQMKTC
jgi:hypothetical protein